jgi:mono/diheme cytochrome c family protein
MGRTGMKRNVSSLPIILFAGLLGFAIAAPVHAEDLAVAQENYVSFCVKCHGSAGLGDGPASATLKKKPRNFTNCSDMGSIPDATLFRVIHDGGGTEGLSPDMPSWSHEFDNDEIHDLIKYVRAFCKK